MLTLKKKKSKIAYVSIFSKSNTKISLVQLILDQFVFVEVFDLRFFKCDLEIACDQHFF